MKRFFVCLMFASVYGFAQDTFIEINERFSFEKSSAYQIIYKSTSAFDALNADAIKQAEPTDIALTNTPSTRDVYWIKFCLKNTTSEPQKIMLEHPRAGLDFIDVYVYKDDVLYKRIELGDMRLKENRSINHFSSVESLTLEPNALYTVVTRLQSYGPYELWWQVESINYFTQNASFKTMIWGITGGILIALILYNIVLYVSLKELFYMIYAGYMISLLLFHFLYQGFAYQFFSFEHFDVLTIATWVSIRLFLFFLLLMPYFFFQLQNEWYGKVFLGCASVIMGFALFFSCAVFNMDILYYSHNTVLFGYLFALYLIAFCVLSVIQKRLGSLYFAIAKIVFTLCMIYDTLVVGGYIQLQTYSWLVLPFGIVIDLLFLSLAHGKKIKRLHQQQRESEDLLIAQSRFIALGQTVGNITHQCKTPISQLASHFMFLHATFIHKREVLLKEFEKKIPQIVNSIEYIQENIDLFSNFFKHSNDKTEFNPIRELKTIEKILEVKLMLNMIEMRVTSEIDTLYTHKSALTNCLMILCENAIDALVYHDPLEKYIDISFKKLEPSKLAIVVQDNAGKVDTTHIQQLFSSNYTTKKDNFGLGLSIVKTLVEKKLEGKISAANTGNGMFFTITIPYTQTLSSQL